MWIFDIPGLLGFGNIAVTDPDANGDGNGNGGSATTPPTKPPTDDNGAIVRGTTDELSPKDDKLNPGAFVAIGVASLILIFVALFVCRRRRRSSDDSLSKHRELPDDEDDEGGMTTDDDETMQASPPRKSYVVGENESLQSWTSRQPGDGQEVYMAAAATDYQHSPHHECSSPNCEACEKKRQQGTRFVMADPGIEAPTYLPADSARQYEQDDTVDL